MELIKILAVCLIAIVPIVLLKQYHPELAVICATAAVAVIFILLSDGLREAITRFYELCGQNTQISYYFKVALKALGIAYITGFVADMCRDFGQSALAAKAELAGKLAVFAVAVPLLDSLLKLAVEWIK